MVGTITRGTTNPNRLRRCDRWAVATQSWRLRAERRPIAVDLGYGASPVTAVELHQRLRGVHGAVEVVGMEIDPVRVAAAQGMARAGLSFVRGGFEVPLPAGRTAALIRAFNVLRQYDESEVGEAWALLQRRLSPQGVLIDGTCDEIGRRATWIAVDRDRPLSLTISVSFGAVQVPSDVAERLPKSLIHRNVHGEPVQAYLAALDECWTRQAPLASYGRRQRFLATVAAMRDGGWPIIGGPSRWRLGEVTVAWDAVQPRQ